MDLIHLVYIFIRLIGLNVALYAKAGAIAALVNVFKDVFAGLDVSTDFHVDVSVILGRQIRIVGYHLTVVLRIIL